MKNEEIQNLTNQIQEKIGNENNALISDEISSILLDNEEMNSQIKTKDIEIEKLKKEKDELLLTNSKLFQKISIGTESVPEENKKNEPFNFKNCFDEKGNFI